MKAPKEANPWKRIMVGQCNLAPLPWPSFAQRKKNKLSQSSPRKRKGIWIFDVFFLGNLQMGHQKFLEEHGFHLGAPCFLKEPRPICPKKYKSP